MKFIISVLLVAAVGAFASAAPQVKLPTYSRLSSVDRERLRQIIKAQGGCSPNVCFALDGSGSVNQAEFVAQKNFVLDVVSIINVDVAVELAAVQYGVSSSAISPLTFDSDKFILAMDAEQRLNAPRTFIRAGILYCFNQLRKRPEDANKIVLLGDGNANLGGDPVPIAKRFRDDTGGDICAVGVGYTNTQSLLDIVGGDSNKVLTVDDFFELSDILEALVAQVCGVKL